MARKPSSSHRGNRAPGANPGGRDGRASRTGEAGHRFDGQRDGDAEAKNSPARDRDDAASAGGGTTETGAERQGMGRGHRRDFDKSDDDAITRGPSRDDDSATARDAGVNRRSRPMDGSMTPNRSTSRGGRSGRRSDW